MSDTEFETERPEITVADINSKLRDLPRDSEKRSILRMLSVGIRPSEIAAISSLSPHTIHRKLYQMFPTKEVHLHDFRKRFAVELAEEDIGKRKLCYFLNYDSVETAKAVEEIVAGEEVDPEYLPEEIQEQLEDVSFESEEKLLERFCRFLDEEADLPLDDVVDYSREIGCQLGLEDDKYQMMLYIEDEDLVSSARDQFSKFLDSSYAEKPEKASEEGV